MIVIIDTSTIQHKMSGTGYYTLGMLKALLEMDFVDSIQTLGGSRKLLEKLNNGKLDFHFPDEYNWHRLINFKMAGNRPNIQGDIAFFPNYFMPPGFPVPSVVTIHDLSFISHPHFYSLKMRSFYRNRIRHTYTNASRILTVSRESQKQLLKHSGRSQDDIVSISPGPSLPTGETNAHIEAPEKYFFLNGNIEPRKNVNPTLKSFLASDTKNYNLIIAGKRFCGRAYWKEFKQLVDQSPQIRYLGYITNQELKQWYAKTHGVVCCSYIEGFGIPMINARAMQKLCLISKHPALREAAGFQAIAVNANDQNEMVKGFNRLAQIPASLNNSLFDVYDLNYDHLWQQFSSQLQKVIRETAAISGQPALVHTAAGRTTELQRAILKTLAYSAVFKAPIKLDECYRELQHANCSYFEFEQAVSELTVMYPEIIVRDKDFIGLRPYIKSIEAFLRTYRQNKCFIKTHQGIVRVIDKLPWITGVYFSGGTVHASHLDEQDIDLFILTKSNRTWIAYTLLKILAFVTGKRSLLCFNYLIDDSKLQVQSQQDLYTAHQILHLKPAVESSDQPDIKLKNPWIYNFFPNSKIAPHPDAVQTTNLKKQRNNVIMETLNLLLMTCWSWFWGNKGVSNRTGGTRWDAHHIKLHTHDHRPFVYERFSAIQAKIYQYLDDANNENIEFELRKNTWS